MTTDSRDQLHAHLTWDEDGQPLSAHFDDVYFSRHDGLTESRHVFLQHNQLAERFAALPDGPGSVFTIGETGFGTGLNFLAAWQLWREAAPKNARLHFISVEKYPLVHADLVRALALWPSLAPLTRQLLAAYPAITGPATHRLNLGDNVSLTLIIGDASDAWQTRMPGSDQRWSQPHSTVDAWFLDGFAPAKNPEMWSEMLFAAIGQLSAPGTTAATFSAAGIVKRGLAAAGFQVDKVPGFGRKRHMLAARKTGVSEWQLPHRPQLSYTQLPRFSPSRREAVIIGSGLAGSLSARALAERGWRVTVIERTAEPASGASGNPQGLVYAKLGHRAETLPLFNLAALQFAQRYYDGYWADHCRTTPTAGAQCGVLQLALHEETRQHYLQTLAALRQPESLVRWVEPVEASALAGISLPSGGLYFPHSGWIDPRVLCRWALSHANITPINNREAIELQYRENQWQVINANGEPLAAAAVVVVAAAEHSRRLSPLNHLPLKPVRGQISYLPATADSERLRLALCAKGYLAPASDGMHCLGATFNVHEHTEQERAEDHAANLEHLREFGPALTTSLQPTEALHGRVAFRCTTPDYLPIVGPAPDAEAFTHDYRELARDARRTPEVTPRYWPGLYIHTGLGSRGLAYAPLCAEILACQLNGEPLPLQQTLVDALHPGRFLIRGIIRNRAR